LQERQVRQVAMESTGVYWIPIWNILEASRYQFKPLLVNPAQVRAMAGRKTDQIDCGRIAEYLQDGRLAGSFIPPPPIREARAVERYRVHVQQDRNRAINRIGRLLQTANLKLSSVLSNVVGVSGLRILRAIAQGQTKGAELAELVHDRLSAKKPLIIESLEGCYSEHFRYILGQLLEEYDRLNQKLDEVTRRLGWYMAEHAELVERMCQVPGIDKLTAWTVLAEVGTDLADFPDAAHLASWAALCPGNKESAGKRKQERTRKGNPYLRRVLVQAAWAAAHTKRTYFSSLFLRFARRQGMKKAAVSVAHRMLVILYHIIRDGASYQEKGDDYFDRLHPERTVHRLLSRLQRLGYDTTRIAPRATGTEIEKPPENPQRRGRPCKCAERGQPCSHLRTTGDNPQPKPAANGSHRLPQAKRASITPSTLSVSPPNQPRCRMCEAWGIACIHVRPRIKSPTKPAPPLANTE
jgi:transposase